MTSPIPHGTSIGAYQRCVKRPEGSCRKCKDFVRDYQRAKSTRHKETSPEIGDAMPTVIRISKYVFICNACNKEVTATEANPTTGVVGEIAFPNSAYGQRRTFSFYSCKEDAAHIARAMRTAVAEREENVARRKSAGEAYHA